MSVKHPIISVTGSSGAGTTSVKKTFKRIFNREQVKASFIDGDAFHRYDRVNMKRVMAEEADRGNHHFSHFGPEANLLKELETVAQTVAARRTGVHNTARAVR
jgi:phosphoribulokinase